MAIQLKANLDGNSGVLQVNGNDAITFDSDGNVTITGTLTAAGGGVSEEITGDLTVTGSVTAYSLISTSNVNCESLFASAQVSAVQVGGQLFNANTVIVSGDVTAANFNSTSDARLKSDIQTINGIDLVKKIRPVAFKWQDGMQSYGVLAQELREVFPSLVSEGEEGYLSVSYTPMIAMLVDAVQRLSEEVEQLKGRV